MGYLHPGDRVGTLRRENHLSSETLVVQAVGLDVPSHRMVDVLLVRNRDATGSYDKRTSHSTPLHAQGDLGITAPARCTGCSGRPQARRRGYQPRRRRAQLPPPGGDGSVGDWGDRRSDDRRSRFRRSVDRRSLTGAGVSRSGTVLCPPRRWVPARRSWSPLGTAPCCLRRSAPRLPLCPERSGRAG